MAVDALNARFARATASNNLADAGILLHQFDNTEADMTAKQSLLSVFKGKMTPEAAADLAEPWMPCPWSAWCASFGDRLSASLISEQMPYMFSGHAGYIFSPAVNISCSYCSDGGTMAKMCNQERAAPTECVPGCGAIGTSETNWCDTTQDVTSLGADLWDCAFRPADLGYMLQRKQVIGSNTYNELVINTAHWQANLPGIIDAFFFLKNDDEGESKARSVHKRFHARYPDAHAILIQVESAGSGGAAKMPPAPFVQVEPV